MRALPSAVAIFAMPQRGGSVLLRVARLLFWTSPLCHRASAAVQPTDTRVNTTGPFVGAYSTAFGRLRQIDYGVISGICEKRAQRGIVGAMAGFHADKAR